MSEKLPSTSTAALFKEMLSKADWMLLNKIGRITRNPIGLRNEKGEKSPPLSPEDFKLARNNFHCFFYKDDGKEVNIGIGRTYRKTKSFQQCFSDHPKEMQKLVDELSTYRFRRCDIDRETNQIVDL